MRTGAPGYLKKIQRLFNNPFAFIHRWFLAFAAK